MITGHTLPVDGGLTAGNRWDSAVLQSGSSGASAIVALGLGVLVVLTGVAGSGKSSLIHGSVAGRDGVVSVDQGADPRDYLLVVVGGVLVNLAFRQSFMTTGTGDSASRPGWRTSAAGPWR